MIYAQIDPESKLCVGIHQMSEYNDPNYIRVDDYDTSYLGMIWDGEKFIENPNPPQAVVPEPSEPIKVSPSDTDLTIMESIADSYEQSENNSLTIMNALADLYEKDEPTEEDSTATS